MSGNPNTIFIESADDRVLVREALAIAAFTPGHLIEKIAAGFQLHSNAGGNAQRIFALEQLADAGDIDRAYVAGETARGGYAKPGDKVYGFVPAAAPAIVVGDELGSNGDGTVVKFEGGSDQDGMYDKATILISATATAYKTTTTCIFKLDGVQYSKAAEDPVTFTAANTINVGTAAGFFFGAWLVQVTAAGVLSTKPAGGLADQVYTSAALALAALPAADAANVGIATIVIAANEDVSWTANTDDMTDASDVLTATFADLTELDTSGNPDQSIIAYAAQALDNSGGASEARIQMEVA